MKTLLTGGLTASLFAAALAAQAPTPNQTPTTRPTPPAAPQAPAPTAGQTRSGTTITGCLYHEKDVPGRTPNVAEKAGVLEDYILAEAHAAGAAAGSTGRMYKVDGIADEQLKALVGTRVEVMGRVDAQAGTSATSPSATKDRNPVSPDDINLPDIEATSIRAASGGAACPARPAAPPVVH